MCSVSAIYDYGQKMWPGEPHPALTTQWQPNTLRPTVQWLPTPEQWAKYQKLIDAAKLFDAAAQQPDCEDPKKQEWFDKIDKRLAAIEEKLNAKPVKGD